MKQKSQLRHFSLFLLLTLSVIVFAGTGVMPDQQNSLIGSENSSLISEPSHSTWGREGSNSEL